MICPLPCEACGCHERLERQSIAFGRLWLSFLFVFALAMLMCAAVIYLAVTA